MRQTWRNLCNSVLIVLVTMASVGGLMFAVAATGTRGVVVSGTILATVSVWFYLFQKDAKQRRMTVWTLLWLVAAVAIGIQLGLLALHMPPLR